MQFIDEKGIGAKIISIAKLIDHHLLEHRTGQMVAPLCFFISALDRFRLIFL